MSDSTVLAAANAKMTEQHERIAELEAALNLALMHLEDERAIAAVRAALASSGTEQPWPIH